MKNTWKYLFRDPDFFGEEEYGLGKTIDRIQKTEQGWKAAVLGPRKHTVEITERGGNIKQMTCTCRDARRGKPCRHMAAVLHALCEEEMPALKPGEFLPALSAEDVIDCLSKEQMRKELKKLANERGDIRDALFLEYRNGRADEASDRKISRFLENLALEYGGRKGIDPTEREAYAKAFTAGLSDQVMPLIKKEKCMEAFHALDQAYYVLNAIEADGAFAAYDIIEQTLKSWMKKAIKHASKKEKEEMFSWVLELYFMQEHLRRPDLVKDLLKECFRKKKYRKAFLEKIQRELSVPDLSKDKIKELLLQYKKTAKGSHKKRRECQ